MELASEKTGLDRAEAHILLDVVLDAGYDADLRASGDFYTVRVRADHIGGVSLHNLSKIAMERELDVAISYSWVVLG